MSQKIKDMIYKNIKLDGLTNDCLDEILEPALKEAVKKTSTPLDDIALAKFYPELEKVVKEKVAEYYAKFMGQKQ